MVVSAWYRGGTSSGRRVEVISYEFEGIFDSAEQLLQQQNCVRRTVSRRPNLRTCGAAAGVARRWPAP